MTATAGAPGDLTGWIERAADADSLLLTGAEIDTINRNACRAEPTMVDLDDYPGALDAAALNHAIASISHRPDGPRYYADGRELDDEDYAHYQSKLNLDAVRPMNPVRYGLVIRRADMRSYPTADGVYKSGDYSDLDRFQENGLFPADAVAVLHDSADGKWLLVQSYNYLAWVRREAIASADRDAVRDYRARDEFVVVIADRIYGEVDVPGGSESALQFDMAVKLPLAPSGNAPPARATEQAHPCHVVQVPAADADGRLRLTQASIAANDDVSRGYLPYTRRHLLQQAFRFIGEHYGWGHSRNARDCTGFVAEIFKTFGILLPRNSDDQGRSRIGRNLSLADKDTAGRMAALETLDVGNLVYLPGHVAMYIGHLDGEPWVIHDVARLGGPGAPGGGRASRGGVSIAPLLSLEVCKTTDYLGAITRIKAVN